MPHDFSCEFCGSKRFLVVDMEDGTIELRCIFCSFKLRAKKIEDSITLEAKKEADARSRPVDLK